MRHIPTMKMEKVENSQQWRCKPQKDPSFLTNDRTFPTLVFNLKKFAEPVTDIIRKNLSCYKFFLPRSRTSSEKVYLSITLVGKIHCNSRKTNRHLSSLICGTRSWCRTFQSTFLQCDYSCIKLKSTVL
jgi:hypothetical protein